jgi:hypothetical protein
MRALFLTLVVLALCGRARADVPTIEAPVPLAENVIATLTFDFNGDGAADRLLLVEGDNAADLYIYQSVDDPARSTPVLKLVFYKKDIAYSGGVFGQLPSLQLNERGGAFKIKSENVSIGRNRWTQVLTIAYRAGQFMVIGVTYTAYDTLDPNSFSDCDLNLANGKAMRKGKAFPLTLKPVPLADWSDEQLPRACLQ